MARSADPRPRIVVGVDGSEHSKHALRWAARIARAEGARIDAITAWDLPTYLAHGALLGDGDFPEKEVQRIGADTVNEVFGADRPDDLRVQALRGHAAMVLVEASKDALMLVVGSRGHGGFRGLLLGSVSANVAEHATCPVLVVHEPRKPRPSDQ